MSACVSIPAIIASLEGDMGRRRYQRPDVLKTKAERPQYYFRARLDVLTESGTERKEKYYYLGFCDEITKRTALKMRDAILEEAVNKPVQLIQSQVKFSTVIQAYEQDHLPNVRAVSAESYRSAINKWIEPFFGDKRLCDIDTRTVQQWLNGLAKLSGTSRRNLVRHFSLIWNRAIDWGYTQQANPARRLSFGPKRAGTQQTIPSMEQFRAMLGILPEPTRTMAELAAMTGMRISEIRGIPVGAVDLVRGTLTITQRLDQIGGIDDPKSLKSRRVLPLGAMASRIAAFIPPGSSETALVFGNGRCYVTLQDHLRKAAKAVGYERRGFGWHTLRKCHNSWFRRSGASVHDAMEQLGHTTSRVNDLYLVAETEDFKRREAAVLKLQEEIMGKAEGAVQ